MTIYYKGYYSNSYKISTIHSSQLSQVVGSNVKSYNLNLNIWVIYNKISEEISVIYKPGGVDYSGLESSDADNIDLTKFLLNYDSGYFPYYVKNNGDIFSENSKVNLTSRLSIHLGYNRISSNTKFKFYANGVYLDYSTSYGDALIYSAYPSAGFGRLVGGTMNIVQNFKFKNSNVSYTSANNQSKNLAIITFRSEGLSGQSVSDLLLKVQVKMNELKILPPASRFLTTEITPFVKLNFFNIKNPSESLVTVYSVKVPTSNATTYQESLLSPDSINKIQLPKPKYDADGRPVRRYVKVTRTSMETTSPMIAKRISLEKITEIIPQQFSYPFSAIVGTQIDSRAFSQIPNRTFLCKLKKILVPSNYFPLIDNDEDVRYKQGDGKYKIYEGDWDGTFKLSWSNNPAWILMDLLINKRYGLGNYIQSDQVDIWELYKIARWCDNVDDNGYYYGVDDSYGGVEPRFTFNAIIKDSFNIFDMVNQVASIFHGNVYYMNSLITFTDDRVKDPVGEFNNSDVKDGLFNYSNLRKDEEFTAVDITYLDSKDNFKAKIEYVEDSEAIRRKGILKKVINTMGITSRGQAIRYARNFLFQTTKETSSVSFTTDSRALLYKPGDLVVINDDLMSNFKNYGIVKKVADIDQFKFQVVIDNVIDSGVFNANEISLFTPIAKPKYEDIAYSAEAIPKSIALDLSSNSYFSNLFSYSTSTPESTSVVFLPSGDFDLENCAQNYSGLFNQNYRTQANAIINRKYNLELRYIKDFDLNNNLSRFGHWQITTGGSGLYQNLYKFDYLADENLKSTSQYRKYYFNFIDTAKTYSYLSNDIDGKPNYSVINKQPSQGLKFEVKSYEKPTISYLDVIQNEKPSIETFQILSTGASSYSENGEIYNNYTEIILSKSGIRGENFYKIKDSVKYNIDNIIPGSSYSLSLNTKNNLTYKILSISENYINEYNIAASEYNICKFKQLEENYSKDDIRNTFNYISAYNSYSDVLSAVAIPAPILDNLERVIYQNKNYIIARWSPVDTAQKYNLYILTPSKQTKNNAITFSADGPNYDSTFKKFEYGYQVPNEVGTYTFYIEAFTDSTVETMKRFSIQTSKSINIIDY